MSRVGSKEILSQFWDRCVEQLESGTSFTDVLSFLEEEAKKIDKLATKDALKNCRGRWFELLFVYFVNKICASKSIVFFKLGTASDHSILEIFEGIKEKITISKEFSINMSIPDIVILNGSLPEHISKWKIDVVNPTRKDYSTLIEEISQGHKKLKKNPISIDCFKAFCSLKTSLRPDRKYQSMYEAEFVRALYKRIGVLSKNGVPAQYLMAGPLDANKTRQILENNLSLVSLADEDRKLIKTIDKVFTVNSLSELRGFADYCCNIS